MGEEEPRDDRGRFLTGNNGSTGRPKGSRNKLGEAFLEAMHADFEQHGVKAIETVHIEKPDQYLKVIASILPKQMDLNVNVLDDVPDDELAALVNAARAAIQDAAKAGSGDDKARGKKPARGVSTLQ